MSIFSTNDDISDFVDRIKYFVSHFDRSFDSPEKLDSFSHELYTPSFQKFLKKMEEDLMDTCLSSPKLVYNIEESSREHTIPQTFPLNGTNHVVSRSFQPFTIMDRLEQFQGNHTYTAQRIGGKLVQ